MVERVSALADEEMPLQFGPGLTLSERRVGSIWQLAAWPDRLGDVAATAAASAGLSTAPGPLQADGSSMRLLRTEPLKLLLVSDEESAAPDLGGSGTIIDLSHARTVIRVEGALRADFMARLMPLDLRPKAFPEGRIATSAIHHVAVTVDARGGGLDLYCFRSFGRAMWEHLVETAEQFAVA
ncbi:MAG: hypothetical protein AAGE80_18490 [Pseudomonadota bacterium]